MPAMIDPEIVDTLRSAAEEIRMLRRRNEILEAKVSTMELMSSMVYAQPPSRVMSGEGEDVAWKLDSLANRLDMKEVKAAGAKL